MSEHNKILIKIIFYITLLSAYISLIAFTNGWEYQLPVIIVVSLIIAIKSTKYLMIWVSEFTGFTFSLNWMGLYFVYMIGALLSILVIPIRIVILCLDYYKELSNYKQSKA